MALLILEISQRGHGPARVERVEQLPYSIGRGYSNDLMLADDTVSERHLLLTQDEDGRLVVVNRSSENGTLLGARALGDKPVAVQLPQSLRLGHTQIRLVDPKASVAPARKLVPDHWLTRLCARLPVALLMLALLFATELWFTLPRLDGGMPWQSWLLSALFTLTVPLLLAALTGFISRLLLHRWHYPLQLSIATLIVLVLGGSEVLLPRIDYLLTSTSAAELTQLLLLALVIPLFAAWQITAVSAMARKRALIIAACVVLPLLALGKLKDRFVSSDFDSQPPLNTTLAWPDLRLQQTEALDTFLSRTHRELENGVRDTLEATTPLTEEPVVAKPKQGDSPAAPAS